MLERLHQSLSEWRGSVRTGHVVQEEHAEYRTGSEGTWQQAVAINLRVMAEYE
jgi:hypothetical protein